MDISSMDLVRMDLVRTESGRMESSRMENGERLWRGELLQQGEWLRGEQILLDSIDQIINSFSFGTNRIQ